MQRHALGSYQPSLRAYRTRPPTKWVRLTFYSALAQLLRLSVACSHIDARSIFSIRYFYQDADRPEFVKLQLGVVRTNCMDNLDRTNVAQSAIAKWMLNRQLRDVGVFQEHESVDSHDGFMHDFRNSE